MIAANATRPRTAADDDMTDYPYVVAQGRQYLVSNKVGHCEA